MARRKSLRRGRRARRSARHRGLVHSPLRRTLRIEPLEDRRLLAGVVVGNNLDVVNGDTMSIAALVANDGGDGISLREAIVAANATLGPDEITFAAALSGETIVLGGTELEITEALAIDARPLTENVTIDADQASRIFNITAHTGDYTLSGLTITGGKTTASNTRGTGGAIRSLNSGNLTLAQSTVSGNSTAGENAFGGGVYTRYGDVTLTQSTVNGNSTAGIGAHGGGIYANVGEVTLTQSTVSGNSTAGINANFGGNGGGIAARYVTLFQSTVNGNSTAGFRASGGGIWAGGVTLTQSTVSGNSTAGNDAHGGGIHSRYGDVTLTQSTVSGNSTTGDDAHGGGIYTRYGEATLTQSTVTENHTLDANSMGGGVFQRDAGPNHPFSIGGSIVAGNTAGGGGADLVPDPDSTLTVNFSLIGVADGLAFTGDVGNLTGTAVSPLDPQLGPLAENGGPTQTHALLPGSPAIDAGDPSIVFNPAEFDQRGDPFVRVFDGDGGGGARIDIGAHERQTVADLNLVVDTLSDENNGDYSTGNLSLREAIGLANGSVGSDTITFDAALSGATITLGGTELAITEVLAIDARPLAENVTIDANELSRIFNITASTGGFTLGGLTLTGGRTTAGSSAGAGGAIRSLTSGNLTLAQSIVNGNSTAGNFAFGGGIFAYGSVTLTQSTVSGNSTTGDFALGGGIYASRTVALNQSTVSGNSTAGSLARGGGIFAYGSVTLTQSSVSGNSTMGDGARGGGINTSYIGFVTLSQSTVSGNCTAGDEAHGGGIYAKNRVTLTQSTVSGNSTTGDEAHGGGIYTRYGEATLTQSTVTENHTLDANSMGGGVFHRNTNNNHPFSISGSIVAGNTAGGGGADLVPDPNSTLTVNYSLIGVADGLAVIGDVGNLTGTAVSPLAPQLDPLADNGGPTETHALLPGSPALNAGDPNFDPHAFDPPLLSDQRGLPLMRVFGGRIDIGAFEDQPTPVGPALPGDYNLDGRVNAADYIAWRNTEGDTVTAFSGADGNGDGQVADADYELWRMNFGNTLPPPAATNGSGGSESRGVEEPERGRIEASESHRVAAPPSRTATNSGSRPSDPQPSTFPADDGLLLLLALDRAERSSRQRPSIFDDPGNDRDRPAGWGDPHLVDASIEAASWQW